MQEQRQQARTTDPQTATNSALKQQEVRVTDNDGSHTDQPIIVTQNDENETVIGQDKPDDLVDPETNK